MDLAREKSAGSSCHRPPLAGWGVTCSHMCLAKRFRIQRRCLALPVVLDMSMGMSQALGSSASLSLRNQWAGSVGQMRSWIRWSIVADMALMTLVQQALGV